MRNAIWGCLLLLGGRPAFAAPVESDFPWRDWGEDDFTEAARESRYVLLSLQAMRKAARQKDLNVSATRLFNRLFFYTGNSRYLEIARRGMGYLTSDHVLEAC